MITTMLDRERINAPTYDEGFLWAVLCLLGISLVMVYSASIAIAEADKGVGHNSSYYLVHQAAFMLVGIVSAFIAFNIPIAWWQKMAPYLFLIGLALLVLVLIPGIGLKAGGSRRWLKMFVVNPQPSEFMKLFAAIYVADYTVRKAAVMDSFRRGFMPMVGVMVLVGFLLLREPDFGFAGLLTLLPIAIVGLIWSSPYRMQRVIGFMDPWADPYGKGYQLSHALIAFGRGEWLGVGLGASVEKLLYLPEAHTDFLLAVIAEELGFVGVLTVIGLFAWIVIRSFGIAKEAIANERYFSALLAQGLGVWMGVQGIINMGVNTGLLPTKGLTLPLMSFGGTGILVNCVAMAIVLRVDFENRRLQKGLPA